MEVPLPDHVCWLPSDQLRSPAFVLTPWPQSLGATPTVMYQGATEINGKDRPRAICSVYLSRVCGVCKGALQEESGQ